MNINEAYIKGLDDAENVAIATFNDVLNGMETKSFNNPKMEELRQRLLQVNSMGSKDYSYILDYLLDKDDKNEPTTNFDKLLVELLELCKELALKKSSIGVRMKQILTKIEIDLINNRDKLH